MKWRSLGLCFFIVLCASVVNAFSLDREAFTFTKYDLDVRVEPEQQRLGVRGQITLRNDSQTPQKMAVLQISSSLDWRSIKAAGKPLQFVSQPYASDIDHTGALSEAWHAGNASQQFRLGPDQCEIHSGARSGICGVVSHCRGSGKSFRGERSVRGPGQMESA
jgi:hypothetical protein